MLPQTWEARPARSRCSGRIRRSFSCARFLTLSLTRFAAPTLFRSSPLQDPAHTNKEAGNVAGDNDPVDVVEIGSAALPTGSVTAVKALGVYAMIDDGELDWKVIAIAASDPKAAQVNDVADVEKVFPGELEKIRVWFRDYKTPDGKPQNAFGYADKCLDKKFTAGVIAETHGFYNALKSGARVNDKELSLF